MRKIKAVLRLHFQDDLSQRAIAKSLGISKEAVREYIKRFTAAKIAWPLLENLSDVDLESRLFPADPNASRKAEPDWALVHCEMKQKGATLAILHQEHLAQHPDGIGYSRFCEQYRKYTLSLKRYMRQTYPAGERAFVDYAGPTITIVNTQTGEVRTAQIFVAVLGTSNYIYARANWSQSLPNWIDAHIKFFEHIGAVPKVIVCDNLKSAVTKASRTEPIINSTYQNMAEHYDTVILPARAYKPKDKAKAENGVLIVERWIMFVLRKRLFASLGELNVAIGELLEEINRRPFQKQDGNRKQLLESLDRPAMKSLPEHPYEYVEFHRLQVGLDYHVQLDNCRYSVPHNLTRKVVEAQLTVRTVEIFYQGRRVASHVRHDKGIITDAAHMPSEHRYLAQWNDGLALDWARTIGICTEQFLEKLLAEKRTREQGWRAHHALKKVLDEYDALRLEAACEIALEAGVRSVSRLKVILANQMDRNLPTAAEQEANFEHINIRGANYYH